MPKPDLSKQIKLVADEIVKSKIRDKLLLASRTDLNTKFAQMGINNNKQKAIQEAELLKLKNQIVAQTNSISNQAKFINTLMEKVENSSKEIANLSKEVTNLKIEGETLKIENVKSQETNDELLAQLNGMLQ